jgi:integrase
MATPASDRFRVIYHPLICPDCGSGDITCDEVESGGQPLRHANFRRRVWLPALAASALDIHFHDLRHTGNALVAEAGANLRELMERMGHSTSRAALIYLHSTSERQHMLADAVAARVQSELGSAAEDA